MRDRSQFPPLTKHRPHGGSSLVQADERRSSEWQDWRLSLGGLRGGMIERGGIGGESDLEMGDFNIEEDDFLT